MIYVVFLRISHTKKRQKKRDVFFPSGFIQLLRSGLKAAIFTSCVCDGLTLALEAFGVDTSAGRVGHT